MDARARTLLGIAGVIVLALTVPGFVFAYLFGTPGSVDGQGFLQSTGAEAVTFGHIWAGLGGMFAVALLGCLGLLALATAATGSSASFERLRRAGRFAAIYALIYTPGLLVALE